jgi:AcrR family transcriptional regulator
MTSVRAKDNHRRHQRRAAQREANRNQILDAAELVFARAGLSNASMRAIGDEAGFSSAALYLFFDNRQQLLAETLKRRSDELIALLESTIRASSEAIDALHVMIDETLEFFAQRRNFWQMMNQVRSGLVGLPSDLGEHDADFAERLVKIEKLLTRVMRSGQKQGTIRAGDPGVLARLYMVLNNEHINLTLERHPGVAAARFHAIIDDAFGSQSREVDT